MQNHLESILLRIDTYQLYDDFKECAKKLKDLSKGIPSDVPFDEINEQLIDIDSVAELHETYINKILETDLILLRNAELNGVGCNIYVNPYFIAFFIKSIDYPIEKSVDAVKTACFDAFEQLGIHLNYIYLRLNYSVNKKNEEDLWNICDRTAFPVMEGSGYNGQYTDSIVHDGVFIDLTRTISPSYDNKSGFLDVNIQSKAVFPVSTTTDIPQSINNIVELSKNEISRCFKG